MIAIDRLPPLYSLRPLPAGAALAAQTRRAAASGAEPGTVLCLDRDDRLDCAVLLDPQMPLAQVWPVVYVGVLGLGDGLGAVAPPGLDVTFRWPNVIEANVGAVGRIGLIVPDGGTEADVPSWIALTAAVQVAPPPAGTPADPDFVANLHDEGCGGLATGALLESFARHLLVWMNRWQDDGFDRIRAMWLRHAPSHGARIAFRVGRRRHAGIFEGIDDDGALLLETRGAARRIALRAAIGA